MVQVGAGVKEVGGGLGTADVGGLGSSNDFSKKKLEPFGSAEHQIGGK